MPDPQFDWTFSSNRVDGNGVPILGYSPSLNKLIPIEVSASGGTTASPPSLTPGTPALVTSDGTAIAANTARKAFMIQNLDDAACYVKMGASASSSVFDFVLPACTAANDGTSPAVMIYGYTGVVSILAATGSPRVTQNEYT